MGGYYLKWSRADKPETFDLLQEETFIGRRSDSGIVLRDPYVSRRHAKLVQNEGGFTLVDLESTHGTFVNGLQIKEQNLKEGDCIQLGRGNVELIFLSPGYVGAPNTMIVDRDLQKSVLQLSTVLPSATAKSSDLEKISHVLDFQYEWEKSFSAEKTLQQLLGSALDVSGAERGFLLTRTPEGFSYVAGMNHKSQLLSELEFQTSQSVVEQVDREGKPLFMTEGIDQNLAKQESIVNLQLRAVACMPLKWLSSESEAPVVRGILYLDSTRTMHTLTGLDQKILTRISVEVGNVFEKLELIQSLEQGRVVEKELALAQATQQSLLPQEIPDSEHFSVHAYSSPTRYVGGDYYDFLGGGAGGLTGVLADVSGKGVSAALLSSFLQGVLEAEYQSGAPLDEVLNRTNRHLYQKTQSNRFVTLFLFSLSGSGEGAYISAGHNPAYLLRSSSGEVEELPSKNPILGAFDFVTYETTPFQLQLGDLLVVYSDGVTEAMDPDGNMFEEERLIQLVQEFGPSGGEVLEEKILESLDQFTRGMSQSDDITFLLIERIA